MRGWRGDDDATVSALQAWDAAGASHASVNTMGAGLRTVDEHLAVLTHLAEALRIA